MNQAPTVPAALDEPIEVASPPRHLERRPRRRRVEALVALVGFAGFVAIVLSHATALLEPDDYAYRASIVALSQGHIVLSSTQYRALAHFLSAHGESGIEQWHHLASGKWISEKNPGYPFFAVAFYWAKVLRFAPLFYGAIACGALYHGARAWLGRWGGTFAVWTYCFSGAAIVFAWRATMPSFTDASLIAAGAGGLLWTAMRIDATPRRRRLVGLASFLAIEGAVFIRYTDVVELIVAALAVIVLHRVMRISRATLAVWLGSIVVFGAFVLAFNDWAYGHATSTGYSAGEITFSLSAFWPNLKLMPGQLFPAVPVYVISALAVVAIVIQWMRSRHATPARRSDARRDLVVAAVVTAGWLGMWLLYFNYTWTADMSGGPGGGGGGGGTVHLIRFYLPALGLLALLAAWLFTRLHRALSWSVVAVLVVAALLSFYSMAGAGAAGGGPGGRGGGAFPGGGPGHLHHVPGGGFGFPGRGTAPPRGGGAPPGAP
jgi:hypothetical protein